MVPLSAAGPTAPRTGLGKNQWSFGRVLTILADLLGDVCPGCVVDVAEAVVEAGVVVDAGIALNRLDEVDVEHLLPHDGVVRKRRQESR